MLIYTEPQMLQNWFHYQSEVGINQTKKTGKSTNYLLNIFISGGNEDQYLCEKLYIYNLILTNLEIGLLILVYESRNKGLPKFKVTCPRPQI